MGKDEHNCGENCDCDGEVLTITLTAEDGSETEFELVATFDVGDDEYVALVAIGEDEATLFKLGEDDEGNEIIFSIDSDEEYEMVSSAFCQIMDEPPDEEE